jgi:hypothetical protein
MAREGPWVNGTALGRARKQLSMNSLALKHVALLLCCVLAAQTPAQSAAGSPSGGVVSTALLSFPEYFCALTEQSSPYAYFGFALQIDGHIRYFKTSSTTCQTLHNPDPRRPDRPFDNPMFGEQVTLYGGRIPTRLARENGDVFDIAPSELSTTRSFFLPSVVLSVYEAPERIGVNPHPDLILRECRFLTDRSERDLCLWYQAGFQRDDTICGELSGVKAEQCRTWIANIRTGRVDK